MRGLLLAFTFVAILGLAHPTPALAETREAYLARMQKVCEPGCLEPRQLLRAARRRGRREGSDMAGILDIRHVSRSGDKIRLHTERPQLVEQFDFQQQLDLGMSETAPRSLSSTSDIIVEMDQQTFIDLLWSPNESPPPRSGISSDDTDIVVEGIRGRKRDRPSLQDLRRLIEGRRIVVRGQPRMTAQFVGARRDFRRSQLMLRLASADDLVLLPSYGDDGEPILEGPLENLRDNPRTPGAG
ncbi:MAG: hypothetical protein WA918_02020 [Erythrobacter sp.]